MYKVTMEELKTFLENIWLDSPESGLNEITPLIIGPSGIGKTALIRSLAKKRGMELYIYSLGSKTKFDLEYFPKEENGQVAYLKPRWLHERSILFFDDVHQATPDVQGILLELLQSRTFAFHKFPRTLYTIMAMNPVNDENYLSMLRMDNALATRVTTLEVVFNPETDLYLIVPYLHPLVAAFLERHREFALEEGPEKEGYPYATPRTWEKLSMILYKLEAQQGGSDTTSMRESVRRILTNRASMVIALVTGTVGTRAGEQFINYIAGVPVTSWDTYVREGYISDTKDLEQIMINVDLVNKFTRYTNEELNAFIKKYRKQLIEYLTSEISQEMRRMFIDIMENMTNKPRVIQDLLLELRSKSAEDLLASFGLKL